MTQERADEILRKVMYAKLNIMPQMKDSNEAFHIGRLIGQMQRQLEYELSLEVTEKEHTEAHLTLLTDCSNSGYYCSECHEKVAEEGWSSYVKKMKFCPRCRTKIIGEVEKL